MSNKEAKRKPAAAGFLVPIFNFVLILLITSVISILFNGCTPLSRAQEKPDISSDESQSDPSANPNSNTPGLLGPVSEGNTGGGQKGGAQGDKNVRDGLNASDAKAHEENTPAVKEITVKPGVTLDGINVSSKEKKEIEKLVSDFAQSINREAKNAEINPENWEVSKSETGVRADVEKTVSMVMEAEEGNSVKMIVNPVEPAYSQEQLQDGISAIAQFTTTLVDKSPGRVNNIRLAAKRINYFIVGPGKEFSFNQTVGRTSASEGYQKAIIIGKDNKREYEVGGGICQLSTTLYNAADKAGLKITERHPHTKQVPYVAKGRDAMVNDGNSDMRFLNSRKYPIMIRTEVGSSYVKTWIMENRNELVNEPVNEKINGAAH